MIAAPIWLLVLSAMLHRIECMYEAPQPAQQPQQQQQQPLSPAAQYAALAPNYFGDVLATGGNTNADSDDSLLSASDETLPFAGPNQLLLTGMEKRMKPSLSISNSLDVLRQQVMLDFARRQMRENIKQIEMNRAHLNSIGKRAGSGGSAGQRSEMGVERSTRQHAMRLAPSGKDDMYRVRFQQQQQQQQHRQRQPIDGFADLD